MMEPTIEQELIIDTVREGGTCVVNAFAGSGKTSTLALAAEAHPGHRGIYLAFNKEIALDAGSRMPGHIEPCTIHSLAYRAMRPDRDRLGGRLNGSWVASRYNLNGVKLGRFWVSPFILGNMALTTLTRFFASTDQVPAVKHTPPLDQVFTGVPKGADLSHQWAEVQQKAAWVASRLWEEQLNPNSPTPITHDTYLKQFVLSHRTLDTDLILVDEAQDLTPSVLHFLNGQQANKLWVGDSHQAIYEFRSAIDALPLVAADSRLYLTTSFRFGHAIAEKANDLLLHLGESRRIKGLGRKPARDTKAILCRTNATAIARLMDYARGQVQLAGGKELLATVKQLQSLKAGKPSGVFSLFNDWKELEEYTESEAGFDLAPLVRAVNNFGIEALADQIEASTHTQNAQVTISTVHKSKGKQWSNVVIEGDWLRDAARNPIPPSPAEIRLMYVAMTRAQSTLNADALLPWMQAIKAP